MAIATPAMREILSDAYQAAAAAISVHTASPGSTGAAEASGGSYARKAPTVTDTAVDGQGTLTATISLPPGTYTHAGVWSALTGGTYLDGFPLVNDSGVATPQTLATGGSLVISVPLTIS